MSAPTPSLEAYDGLACARFDPPQGSRPRGDIVAVHGLTRQKRDFDFIGAALAAQGWRFFAFDTPGRGESLRLPPEEYHLTRYAEIFTALLARHFSSPVHWIGTSMGGLIALEMAAQNGAAQMASLTLVDITHRPHPAACARIADYVVENLPILPSVEAYLEVLKINLPLGDVSDAVWRHYAEHQLRKTDAGYIFHFDPTIARLAAPALRAGIDISEGVKNLACPLALVAGGKSDLCTAQEIADLQALKPDLALHLCPDAGHIPALADKETQDFIAGFIACTKAGAHERRIY
ncbi:MAG: alpha/beta fold hydrolase [Alphaproteobacteria bacterium]